MEAAIIAAVIGALGAIAASLLSYQNRKKLNEIHILVNSRLDQALVQITDLKQQRDRAQGIEDAATATATAATKQAKTDSEARGNNSD